jgi:hypothetical protein
MLVGSAPVLCTGFMRWLVEDAARTVHGQVSQLLLFLEREVLLRWRNRAACAREHGLSRLRRRSHRSSASVDVGSRPRCAGRAPRGPDMPGIPQSSITLGGAYVLA